MRRMQDWRKKYVWMWSFWCLALWSWTVSVYLGMETGGLMRAEVMREENEESNMARRHASVPKSRMYNLYIVVEARMWILSRRFCSEGGILL